MISDATYVYLYSKSSAEQIHQASYISALGDVKQYTYRLIFPYPFFFLSFFLLSSYIFILGTYIAIKLFVKSFEHRYVV